MKQDIELSRKHARKITAHLGQCFRNAQCLTVKLKDHSVLYVEGFASTVGGEHGWVELDGKIIDITPGWIGKGSVEYFPGPKYTYEEVLKLTEKGIINKPLWYRGAGPSAKDAWVKAQTACFDHLGLAIGD